MYLLQQDSPQKIQKIQMLQIVHLSVTYNNITLSKRRVTMNTPRRSLAILVVPVLCFSQAFGLTAPKQATRTTSTRREVLQQHAAMFLAPSTVLFFMGVMDPSVANAFANKVSNQYDDRPKRRGPQVCVCVCRRVYGSATTPWAFCLSVVT
jgi:hypothetical protein